MTHRDLVKGIAKAVALEIMHPIDIRLTAIEVAIRERRIVDTKNKDRLWKIIAAALAPGGIYALVQLFASVVS